MVVWPANSDGPLSLPPGHTRRPARPSVSSVEKEEGGRWCSDAVEMDDGGRRSGRRERCCEAVAMDHAATVSTVLQVESNFSKRRLQLDERNTKTSTGENLLGRSEFCGRCQPKRPIDQTPGCKHTTPVGICRGSSCVFVATVLLAAPKQP
jgi:hypothetical protein